MGFLDEGLPREEELRVARRTHLATGTLACERCDAPVALAAGPVSIADVLACPFCDHHARVRDFLTLGEPTRPARVTVRVKMLRRGAAVR